MKTDNYMEAKAKLEELTLLKKTTIEGIHISEHILHTAYELLDEIEQNDLPSPEIFPHADGKGIQFEWEQENKIYLEINILLDKMDVFMIDEEKAEISHTINQYKQAMEYIQLFQELKN